MLKATDSVPLVNGNICDGDHVMNHSVPTVPSPLPDIPADLPKAAYGRCSHLVMKSYIICTCTGDIQFTLYIPIVETLNYFPVSDFNDT